MTHITKSSRTQYFNCRTDGNPSADKPGRYLAIPEGYVRPVFRYWNGVDWQYNRRKKGIPAGFGSRPGDKWAGAAELHPLVAKEMTKLPLSAESIKQLRSQGKISKAFKQAGSKKITFARGVSPMVRAALASL